MKPELTQRHKDKILPLINMLKGNRVAIKGRAIANALNINERDVRLIVSYARKNVTPLISSGNFGYRWEPDINKVLGTIKRTKAHAYSEIETCLKQEKLLSEENRL